MPAGFDMKSLPADGALDGSPKGARPPASRFSFLAQRSDRAAGIRDPPHP
jgi:hypothetical protein